MKFKIASTFALVLVTLFAYSGSASAAALRSGHAIVDVGWGGSYLFSRTEAQFLNSRCDANKAKESWDAAIIDVGPEGGIVLNKLKFEYLEPTGSMNLAFYSSQCALLREPGVYAITWGGPIQHYTADLDPRARWAVATFNYGLDIDFNWKVCNTSCSSST